MRRRENEEDEDDEEGDDWGQNGVDEEDPDVKEKSVRTRRKRGVGNDELGTQREEAS